MAKKRGKKGGARSGAGRKKGIPNRMTQVQREAVAQSGMTPLEYLLSVLRNESNSPEIRLDAAKAAAPYCHPRLSITQVDVGDPPKTAEERKTRILELVRSGLAAAGAGAAGG